MRPHENREKLWQQWTKKQKLRLRLTSSWSRNNIKYQHFLYSFVSEFPHGVDHPWTLATTMIRLCVLWTLLRYCTTSSLLFRRTRRRQAKYTRRARRVPLASRVLQVSSNTRGLPVLLLFKETGNNSQSIVGHAQVQYVLNHSPLTNFIELFSSKVLFKSVAISMPIISTALLWRSCFLTNSSLARIAAALPSDVGLKISF